MGNFLKIFENKILQVIIAIIIPNVGGMILFAVLGDKIAENERKYPIEPSYAPPGWVNLFLTLKRDFF